MITLCIPTLDRSPFLRRTLQYYADLRAPYSFLIADSSAPDHATTNQQTVASLRGVLNIEYRHYPGRSAGECLELLSDMVSTPSCAFLGDDDFLCVKSLDRCMAFLARHSDVGAVHGKAVIFQTEGAVPHGVFGTMTSYPQAVVESDTGAERLKEFLGLEGVGAIVFSVHRSDQWKAMFRGLSRLEGIRNRNVFKDELIATCVSVIRGKVKEIDGLYLVRQVHGEASYRFPHVYDWVTDPVWSSSFQCFHDRIVEELVRQDGLDAERAHAVLKQAFWPYLAVQMKKAWDRRPPPRPSRFRAAAKRVPGLRRAWRALRAQAQRARDPWSLPALLDPASAHHADFMPIYRLVTSAAHGPWARGPAEVVGAGAR